MPFRTYVFKLGRDADLLDEREWHDIGSLLEGRLTWIKKYRKETGSSIAEAVRLEPIGLLALAKYKDLTGLELEHPDQLWALRKADYGSLCPNCARPFRSPKAKLCAECGYHLPSGTKAGKLV